MASAARLRLVSPAAEAPARDGRRRRSQDSRARIVGAMLELVQSGEVAPGAERVAARAAVGLRTVFRHFKDMDSLYREIVERVEGEVAPILEAPVQGATWRERLLNLAARRAEVYERIAPFKRAAEAHRHRSAYLQASQARQVQTARRILLRELPSAIAEDADRVEMLDLILSFEAWNRLRHDQGLSARRAAEAVRSALLRLLN